MADDDAWLYCHVANNITDDSVSSTGVIAIGFHGLLDTFTTFSPISVLIVLFFELARRHKALRLVYGRRLSALPAERCPRAAIFEGTAFSWLRPLFTLDKETLMRKVGMDAFVLLR